MRRRTAFRKKPYKRSSVLKRATRGKIGVKSTAWFQGPYSANTYPIKGILHTYTLRSASSGVTAPDGVRPWVNTEIHPDQLGYNADSTNVFANVADDPAHYTSAWALTKGISGLVGRYEWIRCLRSVLRFTITPNFNFPMKFGLWTGRYDMGSPTDYLTAKNQSQFKEYTIPGNQQGRSITITHVVNMARSLGLTYSQWNADDGTWFQDHDGKAVDSACTKVIMYYGSPDIAYGVASATTLMNIRMQCHQVWQVTGSSGSADPAVWPAGPEGLHEVPVEYHEEPHEEEMAQNIAADTEGLRIDPPVDAPVQ